MPVLYTYGATITASIAEFQSYSAIRYSPTDSTTPVSLVVTGTGWIDLSKLLGLQAAHIQAGEGVYTITAGGGNDVMVGSSGFDDLRGVDGDDRLYGGEWQDFLRGGLGNDLLYGGAGNDTLDDKDGSNRLFGGEGDDLLFVGEEAGLLRGTSTLYGGTGNDRISITQAYGSLDHIFGGKGWDTVTLVATHEPWHGFVVPAGIDIEVFTGGLSGSAELVNDVYDFSRTIVDHIIVSGGGGDDVIRFGRGYGSAYGGDGNDTIFCADEGGGIDPGAGRDVIHGGAGNDDLYETVSDFLEDRFYSGGGHDILYISGSETILTGFDFGRLGRWSEIWMNGRHLGDENANLMDASAVHSEGDELWILGNGGNDTITGSRYDHNALNGGDGDDVLTGGRSDDFFWGGTGADRMAGGRGEDSYVVDNSRDVIIETAQGGYDIVKISAKFYRLSANVEGWNLIGDQNTTLIGNDGAEYVTLESGTGSDLIRLGGGNDTLMRGARGGDGLVAYGGLGDDRMLGSLSAATLYGGGGNDSLLGGAHDALLFGGDGDDTIDGSGGNDVLRGGAGHDLLYGGGGDDFYFLDADDTIFTDFPDPGIDTVEADFRSWTMVGGIDSFISSAKGAVTITGNDLANRIETTKYADTIFGGSNDTMAGGAGNDFYYVNGGGIKVIEEAGGGYDHVVISGPGYRMNPNVEWLTFSDWARPGTRVDIVAGNRLNNLIEIQNCAFLVKLDAGAGNDTLQIGVGEVEITGGAGADEIAILDLFVDQMHFTFTDFETGTDRIILQGRYFGLQKGRLDSDLFHLGTGTRHGFVYDQDSGLLYFNFPGNDPDYSFAVAQFSDHAALSASDFSVV